MAIACLTRNAQGLLKISACLRMLSLVVYKNTQACKGNHLAGPIAYLAVNLPRCFEAGLSLGIVTLLTRIAPQAHEAVRLHPP